MSFGKITCIGKIDQYHKKMFDAEMLLTASATTIVFLSPVLAQKLKNKLNHISYRPKLKLNNIHSFSAKSHFLYPLLTQEFFSDVNFLGRIILQIQKIFSNTIFLKIYKLCAKTCQKVCVHCHCRSTCIHTAICYQHVDQHFLRRRTTKILIGLTC